MGGSGGQQLDPGYKVRAATVIMMTGRKKKVVSQYTCCAIKTSHRKKEEEQKPSKLGASGGEKNQVCPPDVATSHSARPSSSKLFLSRGLVVFLLSWKELLRMEMLVVVDINCFSSQCRECVYVCVGERDRGVGEDDKGEHAAL